MRSAKVHPAEQEQLEIEDFECGEPEPSPPAAHADEMVQECQLSDVGTQPSINTPGAMGNVPGVDESANAQIRSVKKIGSRFTRVRSRINDLERWQLSGTWGWFHTLRVAIIGVLLFVPFGYFMLLEAWIFYAYGGKGDKWDESNSSGWDHYAQPSGKFNRDAQLIFLKCHDRYAQPSGNIGIVSVSEAGDLLNFWGCTIYTAQEVEEEIHSLQDEQVELVEELRQRCGLKLTVKMMDDRVLKRLLAVIDRLLSPDIAHDRLWEQLQINVQEQLGAEHLEVHDDDISCCSCDMKPIKGKRFSKQLGWNTYDVCEACYEQLSEAEQADLTISKGFRGLNSLTDVLPQPAHWFRVPTHGGNWEVDPAYWGMTNAQLLLFVEACMVTREWDELSQSTEWGKEYGHVNGYQLNDSYVKKWTAGTGCSVSLLMNTEPLKAEIMISHAWGESISQVRQTLMDEESITDSTVVWFCILANYQPGDEFGPTVAQQLERDPFGAVIKQAIMMLVLHTSTAQVYKRLWCCFEMGEAVVQRKERQMEVLQRNSDLLKAVHCQQLGKAMLTCMAPPCVLGIGGFVVSMSISTWGHLPRSVTGVLFSALTALSPAAAAYFHWSFRSNLKVDTANAACGNKGDKAMIKAKLVSKPPSCLPALTAGGLAQADSGGFDELDRTILQLRMTEGWMHWRIRGVWVIRGAWVSVLVLSLYFLYYALLHLLCSSNYRYSDDGSSTSIQLWDDSCYNTPTAPTPSGCSDSMMANASVWRDSDGDNCL